MPSEWKLSEEVPIVDFPLVAPHRGQSQTQICLLSSYQQCAAFLPRWHTQSCQGDIPSNPPGGGALLGGQNGALWTILPAVTHADLTVIILAATWSKGLGEANLAGSPNEPHFFSPQKTQGGSQGSPPWFRKVGGAGSRILGGVLGVGWGGAGPCGRWVGTLCLTHLPMQG